MVMQSSRAVKTDAKNAKDLGREKRPPPPSPCYIFATFPQFESLAQATSEESLQAERGDLEFINAGFYCRKELIATTEVQEWQTRR